MKSFVSALVLCASLLVVLGLWLFPAAQAKEDPILALLNLPAPPPPNPWVRAPSGNHPPAFYDRESPPPDDAPIEDLMDYWSRIAGGYQELGFNPQPSDRSMSRILREIEREPRRIVEFMNVLRDDRQGTELARGIYRQMSGSTEEEREVRRQLRSWLTINSDEFAEDLEKKASQVKDVGEYVSNHDELLALAKVDWERAAPIVNTLYNDGTQKVSKTLATWALYQNALRTGGGDVDRYRDELKSIVADKKAGAGARDLALDALIKETEWSGRDDWYYSLLEDETLHNLVVDGRTYTGLTTLMYYTSDEGHVAKMLELINSDNINVRSAAVKNLVLRLGRMGEYERNKELRIEIVKALLPWFRDPNWVKEDPSGKQTIVRALTSVKVPEAVPALIAALDEEQASDTVRYYGSNAVANAAMTIANAVNSVSNAAVNYSTTSNSNAIYTGASYTYNPLRSQAIMALDTQADARAIPALRRLLTQVQEYERQGVVKALLSCNGFTTEEQVAAIEFLARNAGEAVSEDTPEPGASDYSTTKGRAKMALRTAVASQRTQLASPGETEESADEEFESYGRTKEVAETVASAPVEYREPPQRPMTGEDLNYMLGTHLLSNENPSDELVRGVVARIDAYDKRDPVVSETLRRIILSWNGRAVNALLLRDLKAGRMEADAVVKLLSVRKQMREGQISDITDAKNGVPAAQGIAPCLLEDAAGMEAVLDSGNGQAKAALLACTRLIRAQLSVLKVAVNLKSSNKLLALAAERYLEAEDSPEARTILLSLYPNQAKILGAKTTFEVNGMSATPGKLLAAVFASVSPYFASEEYAYSTFNYESSFLEAEKRLQKEVLTNPELIGVYAYGNSFVHIYNDRVVFSWSDDPARYRERALEQNEWENLKRYLAHYDVDKLPPFLACTGECDSFQLLMLSKHGGRRIFAKTSDSPPEFIAGLDKIFLEMRERPAKLKYYAGAAVPGLEVHFADERFASMTIWKEGSDVRVLVSDEERTKSIESEIGKLQEEAEVALEDGADNSAHYQKFYKMREDRKYDSFGWFRLAGDSLGEGAPQPQHAEYIPVKDGFAPPSESGQWKAKTPTLEIRGNETGLYKITAGRVASVRTGHYGDPVVTANGRWVIATKYSDDAGTRLVRINLLNNREFPIQTEIYSISRPLAYIASVNRVLVTSFSEEDHHGEYEDENYKESAYDDGRGYYLLDPDTGAITPSVGEVRPIAQQTFRGLQPTGAPGEFWAAIPRGTAGTLVGTYSTRTFTFKPMLKLPKIIFDSTEMWVDRTTQRVWFTYEGHVLSAPLK